MHRLSIYLFMYMGVCLYTSLCLCIVLAYIPACYIFITYKIIFFSLLSWNAHSQCAKYLLLISKLNTMRGEYDNSVTFSGFEYCDLCSHHVKFIGQVHWMHWELYCIRSPVTSKDHTGQRMGVDLFWRFRFHCFQAHWL